MQDKDITHAHHSKIEKLASESRTSTSELSFNWVKRLLHRAPIRRKIGLGYTLALGIAVLGTTTGQLVGDFYTKQASQKLNLEQNEAQLLSKLKIAVVETQSHQQKLVILISDLEQFEHEKFEYLEQKKQVKQLFAKLTFIVGKNFDKSDIEIIDLEKFLKTYNTTHANYNQQLDKILQRIAPKTLQPEKVTAAQKLLWDFTKSDVSVQFNQLSEDLTKLVELAYEGQERAETALYQAQVLNIQITIASLLLSIAIATASVFYTSRTISYPLEAVTQVAKKATQEFNFNLQAPVTTQDEVGVLATSLNSLIKWVAEYIQELELARANLEKRVEER
ncbi:MAG TPA: HAMP domain-containing protein, partial [Oculatellaceae cyanobacterium]